MAGNEVLGTWPWLWLPAKGLRPSMPGAVAWSTITSLLMELDYGQFQLSAFSGHELVPVPQGRMVN